MYQPHPGVRGRRGGQAAVSRPAARATSTGASSSADFAETGTRELTAEDYVYQIKRLAHPRLHSPIFGLMSRVHRRAEGTRRDAHGREQAAGRGASRAVRRGGSRPAVDRPAQVPAVGRRGGRPLHLPHHGEGQLSAVPLLAGDAVLRAGAGRGRPLLRPAAAWREKQPHARLVSGRHRALHAHREQSRTRAWCSSAIPISAARPIRAEGEPGDRRGRAAADAGKTVPFIDKVVFTREKESIPYWNKFLQGYYDQSGISSDNFDQAVRIGIEGEASRHARRWRSAASGCAPRSATSTLLSRLQHARPGGRRRRVGARTRKLRQAISIAHRLGGVHLDLPERPRHSRQGPIPPGIFGYRDGAGRHQPGGLRLGRRRSRSASPIEAAQQTAGRGGLSRTAATRRPAQPLVLYLDHRQRGPGDKPRLDWYRKQFAKIERPAARSAPTDYNRFQDKMRKGNAQLFFLGLERRLSRPGELPVPAARRRRRAVKTGGENAANYANPEFDRLFEQMKNMHNGPERQAIIDRDARDRCATTRRGCGASTPRTTALAHALGHQPSSPTRWRTTASSTSASTPRCASGAARVEPARRRGRSPLLARCCSRLAVIGGIAAYRRREREVGARREGGAHDRLHHPPACCTRSRS